MVWHNQPPGVKIYKSRGPLRETSGTQKTYLVLRGVVHNLVVTEIDLRTSPNESSDTPTFKIYC